MQSLKDTTVAVAMSGGVDSSVTAALLIEQGAKVQGVFMSLAQPDVEQQIEQVRKVTGTLNIPLEVLDLQEPFERLVLSYFRKSYALGQTPNPCVICNRTVKFGLLLDEVKKNCHYMATGHYAQLQREPDGRVRLLKGNDPAKDQSYFLFRLSQEQLAGIHFPLGGFTKTHVRELAAQRGLDQVHGKESQDVCFLQNRTVQEFLEEKYGTDSATGPILTLQGEEIGRHAGIHRYTVGQRRGLGLPDATPWYVVGLDHKKNAVFVGKDRDLWQSALTVGRVSWMNGTPAILPDEFDVKIRSRHQPGPAKVEEGPDNTCIVTFSEPQRAITPGQFAVFYKDNEVMGGGEILAPPLR